MEDKKGLRRIPLGIVATLATIVLASGGAAAWFTWRALNPASPPAADFPTLGSGSEGTASGQAGSQNPADTGPGDGSTKQPDTSTLPADSSTQVYWLTDVDGRLQLTAETLSVPSAEDPDARLAATLNALLAKTGNPQQDAFSTIPDNTQLLEASVRSDGIHVNLSSGFQAGGGSAAMIGRLGQVIYTATAADPTAPVWLSVEGKPLTLLGGEGLEVSQPMTRADFNQAFGF